MSSTDSREDWIVRHSAALAPAERAIFLDGACAGDAALRQRLEALLAPKHQPEGTTATAPQVVASTIKVELTDERREEAVGQTLDRYKLLEKVGEGGCGVVYVAEQTEPVRRRVALKVIKLGMDTCQVVARFEAERQALAMMDHPNIAKVFDAGTTENGRPFFVMELVRGIKITEYCDQNHLSTDERLGLFVKVCQAIQHAHQKGIIHRDIKPSNILVTLHDSTPVPKVIDFGIAKATEGRLSENTVYTQLHQFIGTPAYMSPEQAEMSGLDIDTRSDIYSLGALLYELLVGQTPFDPRELLFQGIEAMRRTIREKEPIRPSTRLAALKPDELTTTAKRRSADSSRLAHLLRGDLDWIVMKCLEKDRTRRYETANGLAMDIQRHLTNQPVMARPPNAVYLLGKTIRRHRLFFVSASAITLALLLGFFVSVTQMFRARRAEEVARKEAERKAQVTDFLRQMLESVNPAVAQGRADPVLRAILEQASRRAFDSLASQPELAMELVRTIGRTYGSLGQYEQAEGFQREVLKMLEKSAQSEKIEGAQSLYELAVTRERQGKEGVGEAISLLGRALEIAHRNHGDGIEARILLELAFVDLKTGELSEAERLARKGVALLTAAEGPLAPDTLAAETRVAEIQFSLRRNRDAIATAQRVLAAQRQRTGLDNPDALRTQFLLAAALQSDGRFAEAEQQARECLEGRKRVLGEDHPSTLASMDDLAIIYSYLGRYAQAERVCRAALAIQVNQLGAEHGDTLAMKGNLAEYLRNQGRYDEAEALFKEILDTYSRQRVAGPDKIETQSGLVLLYQFAGRQHEAEELAREILKQRRKASDDPAGLADALALLTTSLLAEGQFVEAETLASEALRLRESSAPDSWLRYAAQGQLGLCLAGLKRSAEAELLLENTYRNLIMREATIPAIEKARIAEVLQALLRVDEALGRQPESQWQADLIRRRQRATTHDQTDL